MPITAGSTLEEVAVAVSEALFAAGITATLSGGAAVSIYSHNEYESKDLDFVTAAMLKDTKPVMEQLGFAQMVEGHGSAFDHSAIEWFVEFVSAPLTLGGQHVPDEQCAELEFPLGKLRILTPTQSVMDRLAWFIHDGDPQSRDQALMVARSNEIDWVMVKKWFIAEGGDSDLFEQFRSLV